MFDPSTLPQPVLVGEPSDLPKPASVTKGIWFSCLSLITSLVSFVIGYPQVVKTLPGVPPILLIGFVIFCLSIPLLLIVALSKRKNWARITYLVLYVIGLLISLPTIGDDFKRSLLNGSLTVLCDGLQIVGFVFLFLPTASVWYKQTR